jgi:gliding motility-associated-like protein
MRAKRHIRSVLTGILILNSILLHAQKDCTVPSGSLFTLVSVQPETGYVELTWNLSPSSDIMAYIIYNHNSGYWIAVDTLWDPGATNFIYNSNGTKYFSESYVVAAFRMPVCTSPLSNRLSTMFCTSEIDTCKKQITVNWNRYTGYPNKVLEYRILVSKNGSPLAETYTVDSLSSSYILSDFETNAKYCFAVRAELEGGVVSTSNKSLPLDTKMQRPPLWINADYATTTNDRKIDLSFSYDKLSEINRFSLERSIGTVGSYHAVTELHSSSGSLTYTDNSADTIKVNYYRIVAINNCNLPAVFSNIASNIVLALEMSQNIINLQWNPYRQWNGITGSKKLLIDAGNEPIESKVIPTGDSLLKIDYSDLMYKVSDNEVCFMVEEDESSNPYGVSGVSLSNKICTPAIERISVPNTFTPDHNLVNDTFRPVLSFTPSNYKLIITDLKRKTLFVTSDYSEEWDGTINGNALPEGVYLWFLKVITPSGKIVEKTGTLNLIFNH